MQLNSLQIALRWQFQYAGSLCLYLQRYIAELQNRAPLQAQSAKYSSGWIASPATRDCVSWHWISRRLLPLKPMLNDYSRCVVI